MSPIPHIPTAVQLGVDLDGIPAPVRQPVEIAAQVVFGVRQVAQWGETPCLVFVLWTSLGHADDVTASAQPLSPGVEGAFDPARELRKMTAGSRLVVPDGKAFLGLGVVAEGLTFDDTVATSDYWRGTPTEVAERHADLVACGRSKQTREAIVALTTGWRFQYTVPRHGTWRVRVHAPGEPWEEKADLAAAVEETTTSFERSVRAAAARG